MRILICGLNGAGKSTVSCNLAEKLNIKYLDIENYYFPKKNEYTIEHSKEEVSKLMLKDFECYDDFVFCSVSGNYGKKQQSYFTHIVYLKAPWEVRFERIKKRSFDIFGSKMLEGGELYKQEQDFFDSCKKRSDKEITTWLKSVPIQMLTVDATKTIEQIVDEIFLWVNR